MIWCIYYGDGSTFSSDDGAWEDAPGDGCQIVLFRDPDTIWAMRHNADYFRLDDDGSVVGIDREGLRDHVVDALGLVKEGRMLSKAHFDLIYQQALQDMTALKQAER